ncbi:MAG: bifunctional phosphopantothenoylcysteine decarboxylase/phosphopantothenate--cysteine ligase CoaBC [Chloroflexi bacterium]|nr:MAG: bifunctional phosphopantothenoylcysteine decarboxylase/phosphopantothenate--cysteine ligase CoaBC [Chloroflexota bacterium]RLT29058.1 MAG: bifunctional phosphopantothenoylcysteine decarboxylase/phosphopantothenate--cysteine ligase CoaBC [Chloroflexota bacterium]
MSKRLAGRLVVLGITGSIAAYKSPEIVRALRAEGADVQALLTPAATRFVSPLTLRTLTGHAVDADLLDLLPDGRIGHIVAADSADAILIAPATAQWIGAMASGLAGDVVTAACLATTAPVIVAPAMDGEMWAHAATQTNATRLRDDFGYTLVAPESGALASGATGVGRLAETAAIVDAVVAAIGAAPIREPNESRRPPAVPAGDLSGRCIVVTAGGTEEPIDAVRILANRSSGRQGIALAEAARDRGADVTLIAARVSVPLPEGVTIVRAMSVDALDAALRNALLAAPNGSAVTPADALIATAAVSDFRVAGGPLTEKLRRDGEITLRLTPTPDLLAGVAQALGPRATRQTLLVGFSAEVSATPRAREKLEKKDLDLIVANDVTAPGIGFESPENAAEIIGADAVVTSVGPAPKRVVADAILDRVAALLATRAG